MNREELLDQVQELANEAEDVDDDLSQLLAMTWFVCSVGIAEEALMELNSMGLMLQDMLGIEEDPA